ASYKTDIPTFYGDWFINRLRAGYCKTLNPYNRHVIRVSLRPEDVAGFVFWTKNLGPFLGHLAEVYNRGFPFVVQHTINGYPRVLEQAVVDPAKSVEHVRRVAETYGPRVCVWRYDTIIRSSMTPREFHVETFSRLAKSLEGTTDEVVVSFAHIYRKTLRNMEQAATEHGFEWSDPTDDWKRDLLSQLTVIAAAHNIRLTVCSQPQFVAPGCGEARCVDAMRLADVGGTALKARLKGNRPECGCYEARDIGEYDTCPHGCVYCYAVQDRLLARDRYLQHNPSSESLFPLPEDAIEKAVEKKRLELTLFDDVLPDGQ
ncbi:MAG TPA: DUF1848 domain-containing protein, partial [Gemmataceae bacterium]|nr:DUF1848 domain-containing protein [Gemmataceae bacterium]